MTDYSNYENWFYEDQFLEDDEDIRAESKFRQSILAKTQYNLKHPHR